MKIAVTTLALSAILLAIPLARSAEADARETVALPDKMKAHMLGNMRDHLLTLQEIQSALSKGNYDEAGKIAEKRLGMDSLDAHGAHHMAPFMPAGMRQAGSGMHRAASRFALVAQEASVDNNLPRALGALSEVTQQCVTCHAGYRIK